MIWFYWSVLLVLWLELRSSQAYTYELKPQVKFSGGGSRPELVVGSFADYGQINVGGGRDEKLALADITYGCPDSNATLSGIYDSSLFIAVVELSESCDDYDQAERARDEGAVGVVFYYTTESNKDWSSPRRGRDRLSIPVAVVELWGDVLDHVTGLESPSYTDVSIEGKHYAVPPQQRTFYFIVTAFCILILLSCLWFVASYFRRCRYSFRNRRRQARAQNVARKAISKLKVRSYKASKGAQEVEVCAVCLEHYCNNDIIRILPCRHEFHRNCVDPWLKIKHTCPLCKRSITTKSRNSSSSSSTSTVPTSMTDDTQETATTTRSITTAFSPSFHSLSSSSDSSSLSETLAIPLHQMRLLPRPPPVEVAINVEGDTDITEDRDSRRETLSAPNLQIV